MKRRRATAQRYGPFVTTMIRYPGKGGWTFAVIPKECAPPVTRPWGRTPVHATLNGIRWSTSVWRDRNTGGALLPVPKRIREALQAAEKVTVELTFEREEP
jgi:hypothetical protein